MSSLEQFKPNYPKTKFDWCVGRDVPVIIHLEPLGSVSQREGTVTALDPKQRGRLGEQLRGLALEGGGFGEDQILRVVTKRGKDVTRYITHSISRGGL